ncbi:putative Zn(II)2Cys6 transcription factor [Dactylonectria macrodidyma]|uniref:Zn(II)2Cys6 transcription factor n=1 Tax=Dactylonectria macrodidyma TaxID=307937 RepID=A0A9P9DP34_9HYPO|nr:putative Zn(II)2Cys6 transcription factor [Dactylonectria macrodidyma]
MHDSETPERRRKRPAISCALCRKRKIRCNREIPCSNCVRSKNEQCIYETPPPQLSSQPSRDASRASKLGSLQQPRRIAPVDTASSASSASSHVVVSSGPSSTSASSPADACLSQDVEHMRNRIRQLEEQLSKATIQPPQAPAPTEDSDSSFETASYRLAGTFHIHRSTLFGEAQVFRRSIVHKTRMFGQSHWINGATMFLDMFPAVEPYIQDASRAVIGLHKCKSLAKFIKSRRVSPWPSPPTRDLPSRDVADKLVDCYLRTMETFYRVLHIPTFMRDYEALWTSDAEPDKTFLVLLKLVFAIGAPVYDEHFSLRTSAIQWVYEAHTWISAPEFKSLLSMQSMQINILLMLAREATSVGRDLVWVSTGALLRMAMYMGLHKDPTCLPNRTTFTVEMRRRLWNTILEIIVQSSMSSGGPPLFSLGDFSTEPPSNLDDDQLLAEDPIPKPDNTFTQSSIARALRKTFPVRLSVAKFLNDMSTKGTYTKTLQLDAELRASYKTLCQTLKECQSSSERSPSPFSLRVVDFIMRRYLSSIHIPFFEASLREATYAFSRKVVIDASLRIWCAVYPASASNDTPSQVEDDFARLTACGSTFFRVIAIQACLLISADIRAQLKEEASLGPVRLRPALLPVLEETKLWCLRCLEAGETNMKGYLIACMIYGDVQALMQGLSGSEAPKLLVEAAEEAVDSALAILEEKAALDQPQEATFAMPEMPLDAPPELIEGWDFMVCAEVRMAKALMANS